MANSVQEMTREQAQREGFAVFNGGSHIVIQLDDEGKDKHLCVKLDNEKHHTISVVTSKGKKVTFAFMEWNSPRDGHVECVDIRRQDTNLPQQVRVLGAGPTFYNSGKDEVTLTVLDLK